MTPAEEDALADVFAARVADLGLNDLYPERDEHRPLGEYPSMPLRTCFWSARALAKVYPELSVVYGDLVLIHDGDVARTSHAWNTRADGAIVDATIARLSFPSAIAFVYVPWLWKAHPMLSAEPLHRGPTGAGRAPLSNRR